MNLSQIRLLLNGKKSMNRADIFQHAISLAEMRGETPPTIRELEDGLQQMLDSGQLVSIRGKEAPFQGLRFGLRMDRVGSTEKGSLPCHHQARVGSNSR